MEHVILVAFTVEGSTREAAERTLTGVLPGPFDVVSSWWVADDDRHDGSDNDSAVFVHNGLQYEALHLLAQHGLTGPWNLPRHERRVHQQGRY